MQTSNQRPEVDHVLVAQMFASFGITYRDVDRRAEPEQEIEDTLSEANEPAPAFKRRNPRQGERFRPCEWCNHPLTQRHHLLPFKTYGETSAVLYLCANCHEIFHAYWDRRQLKSGGQRTVARLEQALGQDDPRLQQARRAVQDALNLIIQIDGALHLPEKEQQKAVRERSVHQSLLRQRRLRRD